MIIATAGHVDHGKSTLVHRLTGTDPDRWPEEHARGLTIDLGFAWARLPSGRVAGFVDVPGHRRFVANTLAGCATVDAVLLAVSAREGWMPQTEEHVAILGLLGAPTGVVACTFADRVDRPTLTRTIDEITARLAGTFLEGAVVIPTAADDQASVERLRSVIDRQVDLTPTEVDLGRPRLWIDRSFLLAGAGRVVTGTLAGGALTVGDRVIATDGRRTTSARIRSIHTYGEPCDHAAPGTRVALALRVGDADPTRGQAVVREGQWASGSHLHVALTPVRGEPAVRPRGSYRAFTGTWSSAARLSTPATPGYARLHLPAPGAPLTIGDRIVVRDAGRGTTVAGGLVLAVDDRLVRRPAAALVARAEAAGAPTKLRAGRVGATVLHEGGGSAPATTVRALTGQARPRGTRASGQQVVAIPALRAARRALSGRLAGAGALELPTDPVGRAAVRSLVDRGLAQVRDGRLLAADADPDGALDAALDRVRRAIASGELDRLFTGSEAGEAAALDARESRRLTGRGDLTRVAGFLVTTSDLNAMGEAVAEHLEAGPATTAALKAVLGMTRRHAIPVLEHLDRAGITRRVGDRRERT